MKPITIKLGTHLAKIYLSRPAPPTYTISWYEGRTRHRRSKSDLEEARAEAAAIIQRLSEGQVQLAQVPTERLQYLVDCEDMATSAGMTLWQAVQEGLAHSKKRLALAPTTTRAVLDQLLARKEKDDLSADYQENLRGVLGRFCQTFPGPIHLVTSTDIDRWLADQDIQARTRKNVLRSIRLLFRFAKSPLKALDPDKPTEADAVPMPKVKATHAVEIFTIDEMQRLLAAAYGDGKKVSPALPVLALGAFCGVRTDGEIGRLEWEDIRDEQVIVSKQKLRGAGRRYVPLPENARKWLALCPRREGRIWKKGKLSSALESCAKKAGISWKRNALRHSFISYRVAEVQDAPQVALEAGNSVNMIHQNYRELVTKGQANEWFGIVPKPN